MSELGKVGDKQDRPDSRVAGIAQLGFDVIESITLFDGGCQIPQFWSGAENDIVPYASYLHKHSKKFAQNNKTRSYKPDYLKVTSE